MQSMATLLKDSRANVIVVLHPNSTIVVDLINTLSKHRSYIWIVCDVIGAFKKHVYSLRGRQNNFLDTLDKLFIISGRDNTMNDFNEYFKSQTVVSYIGRQSST